jgi:hypothetical protein
MGESGRQGQPSQGPGPVVVTYHTLRLHYASSIVLID